MHLENLENYLGHIQYNATCSSEIEICIVIDSHWSASSCSLTNFIWMEKENFGYSVLQNNTKKNNEFFFKKQEFRATSWWEVDDRIFSLKQITC